MVDTVNTLEAVFVSPPNRLANNMLLAPLGQADKIKIVVFNFSSKGRNNKTKIINQYAFKNCSNLTNITIPESVTSIGEAAFWECRNLTSLDISSFETSEVTNMSMMFTHCYVPILDMRNFDFNKVTSYGSMFFGARPTKIIIKDDDKAEEFINARLADASKTGVTVERFKA